jgi:AN1-type zinc finger protein 5/6
MPSESIKNRCEKCKKKLGVMPYICKCKGQFCISHLQAEEHNCTYDYKLEGRRKIKKENDVGQLSDKFERI